MEDFDFTPWLDKVAILTIGFDRTITAHILFVDTKRKEIIVDVLAANKPYRHSAQQAIVLSIGSIISIRNASSDIHPRHVLPEPDFCRLNQPISFLRIAILSFMFLIFISGSVFLAILLDGVQVQMQIVTAIVDTAATILYTFSSSRGQQPYYASCPIVQRAMPRLAIHHAIFLTSILLLETTAFHIQQLLPVFWNTPSSRHETPFGITLAIAAMCALFAQLMDYRNILERAHLSFQPDNECNPS